jgi:hypothetical protein
MHAATFVELGCIATKYEPHPPTRRQTLNSQSKRLLASDWSLTESQSILIGSNFL